MFDSRPTRSSFTYRSSWEDPVRRASPIEGKLPRIAATLDLLPPATRDGHLLELGPEPFLASQCLDIVWPERMTHANYFGTAERRGRPTVVDVGGTLEKSYEYDLFSIETDEFPYPDGTLDVVIFGGLVEHLATSPVWALAEMHRVLKSGGHLIVTTPNALSIDRLESVVTGARPMVDRYNPAFGYGARHNREYTAPAVFEQSHWYVIVRHPLGRDGYKRHHPMWPWMGARPGGAGRNGLDALHPMDRRPTPRRERPPPRRRRSPGPALLQLAEGGLRSVHLGSVGVHGAQVTGSARSDTELPESRRAGAIPS